MEPEYTEQDTERARAAEHGTTGAATPDARQRGGNLLALLLIGFGTLLLLGRLMPFRGPGRFMPPFLGRELPFPPGPPFHVIERGPFMGGMVLLTIASCFLFFAFWRRIYGLLIPGCILAGLSLGVTFAPMTGGVSVLWGLALGFLGVLVLGRSLFNISNPWPIFPAIPLFAVGMIVAAAHMPPFFATGMLWLPIMLIAAGLYLGARRHA